LEELLKKKGDKPVSEVLNDAFLAMDHQLANKKDLYSGCTAIVAIIVIEEREKDGLTVPQVF